MRRAAIVIACVTLVAGPVSADVLYGITGGTNLVTIDSALPANATSAAIAGCSRGRACSWT